MAGTDSDVSVQLLGTLGWTSDFKLSKFGNDFEIGDLDEYIIEAPDVGNLLYLKVKVSKVSKPS
jgi:hypothetical protein